MHATNEADARQSTVKAFTCAIAKAKKVPDIMSLTYMSHTAEIWKLHKGQCVMLSSMCNCVMPEDTVRY